MGTGCVVRRQNQLMPLASLTSCCPSSTACVASPYPLKALAPAFHHLQAARQERAAELEAEKAQEVKAEEEARGAAQREMVTNMILPMLGWDASMSEAVAAGVKAIQRFDGDMERVIRPPCPCPH